jgi:hypothetical protein
VLRERWYAAEGFVELLRHALKVYSLTSANHTLAGYKFDFRIYVMVESLQPFSAVHTHLCTTRYDPHFLLCMAQQNSNTLCYALCTWFFPMLRPLKSIQPYTTVFITPHGKPELNFSFLLYC